MKELLWELAFVALIALVVAMLWMMFNGMLPMQQNREPAELCAVFDDGSQYSITHKNAINMRVREGRKFEIKECKR